MTALEWRVVPIDAWIGEETPADERVAHPFRYRPRNARYTVSGVNWPGTCDMLRAELTNLKAVPGSVLLQLDVTDRDIRLDGWIRANARPSSPRVILTFDSETLGHLSYPADTFTDWQANVRAIAVALENLRRVARYGVGRHGEAYRGWKQLPAEISGGPHAVIARFAGCSEDDVRRDAPARVRAARLATHPNAGGDREDWELVQKSAAALGVV